jgi:hypothetical protein
MATFISIAGDEKTEKTQSNPTSASRSRLVSSFPQPLSFLFVISSAFSLAANFTSPSCRCCKFFNHTLLSHSSLLFSSFPKWMSLFFFFFYNLLLGIIYVFIYLILQLSASNFSSVFWILSGFLFFFFFCINFSAYCCWQYRYIVDITGTYCNLRSWYHILILVHTRDYSARFWHILVLVHTATRDSFWYMYGLCNNENTCMYQMILIKEHFYTCTNMYQIIWYRHC